MDDTQEGFANEGAAQVTAHAFSVPEFCQSHRISRALFYLLAKDGRGPAVVKAGRRTVVSAEAAAEWRRRMERASAAA